MLSYLATHKADLGQYAVTRTDWGHKMTIFQTVIDSCLAAMQRGYWLVRPFNNIARYVERMLQDSPLQQRIAQ